MISFRTELKDSLRKPGFVSKVAGTFDAALKFEPKFSEDFVENICKLTTLSPGESLSLTFSLYFSQVKTLKLSAKRFLLAKSPEIRLQIPAMELSDEVRTGLQTLVQADEVRTFFSYFHNNFLIFFHYYDRIFGLF
jgi:hypothetical protein